MKRFVSLLLVLALLWCIPAMAENAYSARSHLKLNDELIYDLLALLGTDEEGRLAFDLSGTIDGDDGTAMLRVGSDALEVSNGEVTYVISYSDLVQALKQELLDRLDPETAAALGVLWLGIRYILSGQMEEDLPALESVLETEANRFSSIAQEMGILAISRAGDIHIEAAADDVLHLVQTYLAALIADDRPFALLESTHLWEITGLKNSGFSLRDPLMDLYRELSDIDTFGTDAKLIMNVYVSGTADLLLTFTVEDVACELRGEYDGRKLAFTAELTEGGSSALCTAYLGQYGCGYDIKVNVDEDYDAPFLIEENLSILWEDGIFSWAQSSNTVKSYYSSCQSNLFKFDWNSKTLIFDSVVSQNIDDSFSFSRNMHLLADAQTGISLHIDAGSDSASLAVIEAKAVKTSDGISVTVLAKVTTDGEDTTPLAFDLEIGDICSLELHYSDYSYDDELVPVLDVSAQLDPDTLALDGTVRISPDYDDYYYDGETYEYRLTGKTDPSGVYRLVLSESGTVLIQGELELVPGRSFLWSVLFGNFRLYVPEADGEILRTRVEKQNAVELVFEARQNGQIITEGGIPYTLTLGFSQVPQARNSKLCELYAEFSGERISLSFTANDTLTSFTFLFADLLSVKIDESGIFAEYSDNHDQAAFSLTPYGISGKVGDSEDSTEVSLSWKDGIYRLCVDVIETIYSDYYYYYYDDEETEEYRSGLDVTLDTVHRTLNVKTDDDGYTVDLSAGIVPNGQGSHVYLTIDTDDPESGLSGRMLDAELKTGKTWTMRATIKDTKYDYDEYVKTIVDLIDLNVFIDPSTLQLTGWLTADGVTYTLDGSLDNRMTYTLIFRANGQEYGRATLKMNARKGFVWSLLYGDLDISVADGQIRIIREAQVSESGFLTVFTVYENGAEIKNARVGLTVSTTPDGYTRCSILYGENTEQIDLGILYKQTDTVFGIGADCTAASPEFGNLALLDSLFEVKAASPRFAVLAGEIANDPIVRELAESLMDLGEDLLDAAVDLIEDMFEDDYDDYYYDYYWYY